MYRASDGGEQETDDARQGVRNRSPIDTSGTRSRRHKKLLPLGVVRVIRLNTRCEFPCFPGE